jgi:hypothetical protein
VSRNGCRLDPEAVSARPQRLMQEQLGQHQLTEPIAHFE